MTEQERIDDLKDYVNRLIRIAKETPIVKESEYTKGYTEGSLHNLDSILKRLELFEGKNNEDI